MDLSNLILSQSGIQTKTGAHPAEGHTLLAAEEVTGALAGGGSMEDTGVDPQGGDKPPQGGKNGILERERGCRSLWMVFKSAASGVKVRVVASLVPRPPLAAVFPTAAKKLRGEACVQG